MTYEKKLCCTALLLNHITKFLIINYGFLMAKTKSCSINLDSSKKYQKYGCSYLENSVRCISL